ncbi:DUF1440 domain-containing protein [Leuconostoc carnosum]|uniref:Integral membrane protein n=2 Tax=Leuconostoc carnosum TaxID=1252 RepID=K0DE28_LEUCJ|nr:DUF1440 domain-containing protein [Leuconostoc carnosum]AFT81782.1 hypothetical protein C270_04355 [Leuconostoc carnosum JB16]KAA8328370.1 DUF1440 domain-containing protein [Leuconostoc carnosum]QEA32736.1 DUF1440 domain-containing protein [Leuconostoc carnosum]
MFINSIVVGIMAGLISGMVKIGWETILPPRSQARDETNPPQQLLQQLGVPRRVTHAYVYYSKDQKIYYTALIMHFGFSVTFAVLLALTYKILPIIALWEGSLYGIVIWFAFHIVILPLLKTVPSPVKQPFAEHFSEFFGHIVWSWSIYFVIIALLGK